MNVVFECIYNIRDDYNSMIKTTNLDGINGLLVPFLNETIRKWIDGKFQTEKKDLNVEASYWFDFISNTIILS